MEHVTSACPILAKEQYEYIKRHDTVCAEMHWNVCRETGVKLDNKHWCVHVKGKVYPITGLVALKGR
jgi:hypothetical protein